MATVADLTMEEGIKKMRQEAAAIMAHVVEALITDTTISGIEALAVVVEIEIESVAIETMAIGTVIEIETGGIGSVIVTGIEVVTIALVVAEVLREII